MSAKVLLVDDDPGMCEMLAERLSLRGFETVTAHGGDEGFAIVGSQHVDVVVTDLRMPAMGGVDLCERIVTNWPSMPVVIATAFGTLETAVSAIRGGAYDFLTKPFEIEALVISLERALKHRRLCDELDQLRRSGPAPPTFPDITGRSPAMSRLFELMRRVAQSDASTLIVGETGTGKELVAHALHSHGRRRDGPFVAVNCAAMPADLLESELFGHVRGAFTDAAQSRRGLFAEADGGSLFLDEVGDLPLGLQPKILRALQERRIRPVGSDDEVAVDVHIISATHHDLESAVESEQFREDLYFRLNVVTLEVPPLRSRGHDILLLAQKFLEGFSQTCAGGRVAGLSPGAAAKLLGYQWPGNVRELQNCMERAVALTEHEQVIVEDLPERIRSYRCSDVLVASLDPSELLPMAEIERRYILRVLEATGDNKSQAARILGFDRRTLYRKLEVCVDGGARTIVEPGFTRPPGLPGPLPRASGHRSHRSSGS